MRDYIYDPQLPIMRMRMTVEPNRNPLDARTAPALGRIIDITDEHPGPLLPKLACDFTLLGCREPSMAETEDGPRERGNALAWVGFALVFIFAGVLVGVLRGA